MAATAPIDYHKLYDQCLKDSGSTSNKAQQLEKETQNCNLELRSCEERCRTLSLNIIQKQAELIRKQREALHVAPAAVQNSDASLFAIGGSTIATLGGFAVGFFASRAVYSSIHKTSS